MQSNTCQSSSSEITRKIKVENLNKIININKRNNCVFEIERKLPEQIDSNISISVLEFVWNRLGYCAILCDIKFFGA